MQLGDLDLIDGRSPTVAMEEKKKAQEQQPPSPKTLNRQVHMQKAMIRHIIESGDINELDRLNIEPKMFDDVHRTIIDFIIKTHATVQAVPNLATVKRQVDPHFKYPEDEEKPEVVAHILRTEWLLGRFFKVGQEFTAGAESGIYGLADSIPLLTSYLEEYHRYSGTEKPSDMKKVAKTSEEFYQHASERKTMEARQYPWPTLNQITGGRYPDDFIVIYSKGKGGKTWTLVELLTHFWRQGERVIGTSLEMPFDRMAARIVCCYLRLDYKKFRRGELSEDQEQLVRGLTEQLKDDERFRWVNIRHRGRQGVDELIAAAKDHRAAFIACDAANHFAVEWKDLKEVTSRIKQATMQGYDNSRESQFSFCCTVQGKASFKTKKTETEGSQEEIGGSVSWLQDCDMVIRVMLDKESGKLHMQVPDYREDEGGMWTINFQPAVDLSERVITSGEVRRETTTMGKVYQRINT